MMMLIKSGQIALALLRALNLQVLHGPPISLILRGFKCLNTTLLRSRLAVSLLSPCVHLYPNL